MYKSTEGLRGQTKPAKEEPGCRVERPLTRFFREALHPSCLEETVSERGSVGPRATNRLNIYRRGGQPSGRATVCQVRPTATGYETEVTSGDGQVAYFRHHRMHLTTW
ncbi:unnamed protein product [Protopolystoma xenopodis]|uniref:Uncharacterized protein n=1 Tax=Protopolystoma xenopodis TaxID=117903 RepID=A0A448X1R2_9PLAT|nr:unnamed protein product [Protopolystoma xenopodis]